MCGIDGRHLGSSVGTSVLEAGVRLCVDLVAMSLLLKSKLETPRVGIVEGGVTGRKEGKFMTHLSL